MTVVETEDYLDTLKDILAYIAKDKKSAAVQFKKELRQKIQDLKDFPFMYRVSIYFEDEYIRDLMHKGYTVPYEVDLENKIITIIGITKYKNSLTQTMP
jgi:plasmid stabilization system protein ParE